MEEKNIKSRFKNAGRKLKLGLGCCSLLLALLIVTAVVVLILSLTGHTKRWACEVVIKDSYIYERLDCGLESEIVQDGNVIDDEIKRLLSSDNQEERVAGIVRLLQPSVVGIGIKSDMMGEQGIVGTGFVLDNQLIATNQHVVSNTGAKYFIQITGQEEVIDVEKIFRDPAGDIAIIKIAQNDNLVPVILGDSDEIMVGESVIAIGNPLGNLSGTVTKGIISGTNRTVEVGRGGFFSSSTNKYEGVIQTDAAINPGNSGGPLINMKGQVIGINFATVGGADNLSFALPINQIKQRISELKEFGDFRTPYLGVEYIERLVFVGQKAVVSAQVRGIAPNSPAANAELKVGDHIVGFNNEDLSTKSLHQLIQESKIGDDVELNVIRSGEQLTIKVKIGMREN